MLITAELQFGTRPEGPNHFWIRWAPHPREPGDPALMLLHRDQFAEYPIHGFWHRVDEPRVVPTEISLSPVYAEVNCNRWTAKCGVCGGAQVLSEHDKRFFCVDCLNVLQGNQWRPVIWPKNRKAIEEILNARPLPDNRHWEPHETVDALARENAAHGVAA